MPINMNRIARVSAFQRNCGLNSLVHVLVKNIKLNKIPEDSLREFWRHFNGYYKINDADAFDFEQFKKTIQEIDNPVHREIILGPVLRAMLNDEGVLRAVGVAEKDEIERIKRLGEQPGKNLEDIHIMCLANFFGIYVESYSSFRAQALAGLGEHPDPDKSWTEDQILGESDELRKLFPDAEKLDRLGDAFGKAQAEVVCRMQKYDENYQNGQQANYPVLILWNESADHFGYEAETEQEARAHNAAYEDRFNYEPHAQFIPQKIKQGIESWDKNPQRRLDLSGILTEYEKEKGHSKTRSKAKQNQSSSMPGMMPDMAGIPGRFGGFSKMLGGVFSTFGEKIFQAFSAPFTNHKGEPDFGIKISSGGWMGIFEGIIHFAFKFFAVVQNLAPVATEFGKAFDSTFSTTQQGVDPELVKRANGVKDDFASLGRGKAPAASSSNSSGAPFTPQHTAQRAAAAQQRREQPEVPTLPKEKGKNKIFSYGTKGATVEELD